ncbi:isopentenyl-diphosphate Delta-isomerase [Oscillatoria amoena NRMC-F 0135]|nr:isopentenyl-diphosphate Delta-isomerase [Oscillatoria amoena NRMC-F 0135]
MEHVILVDELDNEVGTMEKMEAHHKGVLHRAFSVLLFNSKGELLLQKRSKTKYHSAGLWTNTCCSHPRPDENIVDAAQRRIKEEMGIDVQPEPVYSFIYKTPLDNGLIEHELDHVLIGQFDGHPRINKDEVSGWKFASLTELKHDMQKEPYRFTEWFKLIVDHPEFKVLTILQG